MSKALKKLIETSNLMINTAKDMMYSCRRKNTGKCSESKIVVSFFMRRSYEMFESFIMLVREGRIIDSALLLRSLVEMGISLGYIFANDIDEKQKDIRALRYCLDSNRQQLKLIDSNLLGFKSVNPGIEARRDEIKAQIKYMEGILKDKYEEEDWRFPKIEKRARLSNSDVLMNIYNRSYRDLSNIEHHSMLFGQHYVDYDNCEPIIEINHLEHYSQLKLSVSLFFFRIIFIEILNVFNDEFQLKWDEKIKQLRQLQDNEYPLLRD